MVRLAYIRAEHDLDLQPFAKALNISRSTVMRIEAAENRNEKHPMARRAAIRLGKALKPFVGREVSVEELEGVRIAPPRPGRPKKVKEQANGSISG